MDLVAIASWAEAPSPLPADLHAKNYVVVSLGAPEDGGDFGPRTPNTKTAGIQEALNFAKANRKDVYIVGGTMPEAFKDGVVYHLQETVRFPCFQDFRLDGGEYVVNYDQEHGDAIVIDSLMSCRLKFGLIVAPTDGAAVRIMPETKGPDGFSVVTTNTFEFNALVGAGSVFQDGKRAPKGTGLLLDASKGPIVNNKFYATEIIACETGLKMTCGEEGNASTAINDNDFDIPFLHLCSTHLQVGDPLANVRNNVFSAHIDGSGVEGAIGVKIFGKNNLFTLGILNAGVGKGIVFEESSENNRLTLLDNSCSYTNKATHPTNRIIPVFPLGFSVPTPEVPASGETIVNRTAYAIEAMIIEPGVISSWALIDSFNISQAFHSPLVPGQSISLNPGEAVRFDYVEKPEWRWRALD